MGSCATRKQQAGQLIHSRSAHSILIETPTIVIDERTCSWERVSFVRFRKSTSSVLCHPVRVPGTESAGACRMVQKTRPTTLTSKGMVQVTGTTYRIDRTNDGVYEVTRVLDDAQAGAFVLGPPIRLTRGVLDVRELHAVAHAALQNAKVG